NNSHSFQSLKKVLVGLTSLSLLLAIVTPAKAAIQIVDRTAGPLSIFDRGGILNSTGGYYMQGLEVAPDGKAVFVAQANAAPSNSPSSLSTMNRLIKSTGLRTAVKVGPTLNVGNHRTWGNDLTLGPNGRYYIFTKTGLWGFSPTGGAASSFATWPTKNVGSSGITFTPDGSAALVSSDWPGGVFRFLKNATTFPTKINTANVPWDDHVITRTNRTIICTEPKFGIQELLPNGNIVKVYDLKTDVDVKAALTVAGYGARCTIHPVSGDIFWTLNFETSSPIIVRIKANLSDATVFAKGFAPDLRDIDFGRRSSGAAGYSLYVSENNRSTGVGTIYEIPTP
ncbi:hypothetical protein, partial [Merismopedia glauca]